MSEEDFDEPLPLFSCRLCAGESDSIVHIYNDSVTGDDLAEYIHAHLPIRVSPEDSLPLYCCTGCAQTVFDFHRLVADCVCAESLLLQQFNNSLEVEEEEECNDAFDHTYVDVNVEAEVEAEDEGGYESPEPDDGALVIVEEKIDIVEEKAVVVEEKAVVVEKEPVVVQKKVVVVREEASADIDSKDLPSEEETNICFNGASLTVQNYQKLRNPSIINLQDTQTYLIQYMCEFCNEICDNETNFTEHMKQTHADQCEIVQLCPVDNDNTAPLPSKVTSISNRQKRAKQADISTVLTGLKRSRKQDRDMLQSAKVVVEDKVYYRCSECGKNLCSAYTFKWHMRIHTGERPHVCHLCGKQFRVAQGLLRHLRATHRGIKNHPCDICARSFATKRNVAEHRRTHTNERPYVCATCGKAFKQKASLFVHDRAHSDSFPHPCTYCAMSFRTGDKLTVHIRRHTGEKPYKCEVCGRAFRIGYELKRHVMVHSDVKPWRCHVCTLAFRQKRYLTNHMRITHGVTSEKPLVSYTIPKPDPNRVNLHEEPRFVCTKCGKSYKSRSYLNIHVNKVHAEPPAPFKDKIKVIKTGKEFTYEVDEENIDSDDIKNIFHELTENVDGECTISFIAEDTKRYKCDHCALTYSRKYLLRRHIERDHPEHIKYADKIKELYCDYCDDKFAKMELLLEHVRYSHPGEELPDAKVKAKRAASAAFRASCQVTKPDGTKQFKCPECAKCYPTGQSFTNHMVQHRKEAKYCCHICGKRFRMFSSFDRHVRYFHNQERNYECTICDRRFSNPRYRDDHMNIHLDRRPYVCDVCGKSFRQTGGLYIHKLHHNKDESTFKYQCTVCGKKFRRTDALMVHNRIHNGEKPFHCTSCGRDFRLKTLLVKHQATHRDTNAFVCKDCGANFSLMRFLTAHKQKTCKKKRNTDATKKVSK